MIRIVLPAHLRTLAHVSGEVSLDVEGPVTQRSVLDALESRYPMLRGTIRDHVTQQRRPFLRFFACEEDFSHELPDCTATRADCVGEQSLSLSSELSPGARLECRANPAIIRLPNRSIPHVFYLLGFHRHRGL